jgi:hypothetical protein
MMNRMPRRLAALLALALAACEGTTGTGSAFPPPPPPEPPPVVPSRLGGIRVDLPRDSLLVGDSLQGTASAWDTTGAPVMTSFTWSVDDTAFAMIDTLGWVTGVRPGRVQVQASAEHRTGAAMLKVVAPTH